MLTTRGEQQACLGGDLMVQPGQAECAPVLALHACFTKRTNESCLRDCTNVQLLPAGGGEEAVTSLKLYCKGLFGLGSRVARPPLAPALHLAG